MASKRCSCCRNKYPATTEYFYGNAQGKYGLSSWCKGCKKRRSRVHYREPGIAARKAAQNAIYTQTERGRQSQVIGNQRYKAKLRDMLRQSDFRIDRLPPAKTVPCIYGEDGHTAQFYFHYLGVTPEHYADVIPICRKCYELYKQNEGLVRPPFDADSDEWD